MKSSILKYLFLSLMTIGLVLQAAPPVAAQSTDAGQTGESAGIRDRLVDLKNRIEQAVLAADRRSLANLAYELQRMEADSELQPYTRYYAGYAFYRLYTLPSEEGEQEKRFLDSSIEQLQQAVKLKPDFAEAHALLGSGYGMKATGIISGMRYGPRSGSAIGKALDLAPENPRIHLIDGIGKFYKPSMFGGGADHAVEALLKASDRFASFEPASDLAPDWGDAEVYAWLGQAYVKLEQYSQAEEAYNRALEVQPGYGWVQYQLMPALREQMDQ